MRKEVEDIIRQHEQDIAKGEQENRIKLAASFNLFDETKVYFNGDDVFYAAQMGFIHKEVDPDGTKRFYKNERSPIVLTDEEYAALLKIQKEREAFAQNSAGKGLEHNVQEPATQENRQWETKFSSTAYGESLMAKILKGVAIAIWIFGVIFSFAAGNNSYTIDYFGNYKREFDYMIFWTVLCSSAVAGILFMAFANIVANIHFIACAFVNGSEAVTKIKE